MLDRVDLFKVQRLTITNSLPMAVEHNLAQAVEERLEGLESLSLDLFVRYLAHVRVLFFTLLDDVLDLPDSEVLVNDDNHTAKVHDEAAVLLEEGLVRPERAAVTQHRLLEVEYADTVVGEQVVCQEGIAPDPLRVALRIQHLNAVEEVVRRHPFTSLLVLCVSRRAVFHWEHVIAELFDHLIDSVRGQSDKILLHQAKHGARRQIYLLISREEIFHHFPLWVDPGVARWLVLVLGVAFSLDRIRLFLNLFLFRLFFYDDGGAML